MSRKPLPELERLARRLAIRHGMRRERERFAELLYYFLLGVCPRVCSPGHSREDVCLVTVERFCAHCLHRYNPARGPVSNYAYGYLLRVRKELWRQCHRTP